MGWCLIKWTLRQCFDYCDCDSVADSYTFVESAVFFVFSVSNYDRPGRVQ